MKYMVGSELPRDIECMYVCERDMYVKGLLEVNLFNHLFLLWDIKIG
jgi:hypothetical protein